MGVTLHHGFESRPLRFLNAHAGLGANFLRTLARTMSPKQPFDLTGRVAVVSGAAQGLGRAMSLALAEAGADLVLADRNAEGARQTAETITGLGRRALPVTCDVSEPAQIRALFAALDDAFGRVDFLGNV